MNAKSIIEIIEIFNLNRSIYSTYILYIQIKSPKTGEPRSIFTASGGAEKRCCLKTTTKHHRWKRKWNCCSSVPDSPDVTEDVMRSIAAAACLTEATSSEQQQQRPTTAAVVTAASQQYPTHQYNIHESPAPMLEIPDEIYQQQLRKQQFIERYKRKQLQETLQQFNSSAASQPAEDAFAPEFHIVQRHGLPPLRVPNLSGVGSSGAPLVLLSPSSTRKTDTGSGSQRRRATRPWPISRFRQVLRMIGRYRRPDCRGLHRSGANALVVAVDVANENALSASATTTNNDSTVDTHDTSNKNIPEENDPDVRCIPLHGHRRRLAPVLAPPPSRRKIRTDIETLSTYLSGGVDNSLDSVGRASAAATASRFLRSNGGNGGSMRRVRRKNCMRQLSPTLSPIHESGLSNPTSPLPFRRSFNREICGEVTSLSASVAKAESFEQRFVM